MKYVVFNFAAFLPSVCDLQRLRKSIHKVGYQTLPIGIYEV